MCIVKVIWNICSIFSAYMSKDGRGLTLRAKRSPFYGHTCDLKWTGPTRPWRFSTAYTSENIQDWEVRFWHHFDSSLNFGSISLIVWKLCYFRNGRNFGNFWHILIITFYWKGNTKFWWFHRKDLVQICQSQPYFLFLKMCPQKWIYRWKN